MIPAAFLLIFAGITACTSKMEKTPPGNRIKGHWGFLDRNGNYNEVYFADSSFVTFNMRLGAVIPMPYFIRKDSIYTNFKRNRSEMIGIARVQWMPDNRVVLSTAYVSDTLERFSDEGATLANTDPLNDSITYRRAFNLRHEKFLIGKGILTVEEVENFKKSGIVPSDIQPTEEK
jgi:hypothetical protein